MKIVFMGTPDFSVPVLNQLIESKYNVVAVVTQPDRPVGRKKVMTPPPVKVAAERHQIPVYQPEKIRLEEGYKEILALEPDLIITAAYGQILPKAILEAPHYGCINVHASLLPKYRGGAPIHQSVIDGEAETGVTIMYMVEKLDAGDILTQVRVPILDQDDVGAVHDKLSVAGANLLLETIPALVKGEIKPMKQDKTKVSFAKNISREMEKLNWDKPGKHLYNQVRGLRPWPVAFTTMDEKALKVRQTELIEVTSEQPPGTILAIEADAIIVKTGDERAISLKEVQPAGKKRMKVSDFLRGAGSTLEVGDRLGETNE